MRRALMSCLVVSVLAWSCTTVENEAPPADPESMVSPSEDAVFGLSWSDTEEQLIASGVVSGDPEPFLGERGHMYSDVKLPRKFKDSEWCALCFNDSGAIVRVACVGETVRNDPSGEEMRKRYEELKDIISRKIPIVATFEENNGKWPREREWWPSLREGKVQWATGFRGEIMEAILEVRAESDVAGAYSLIVDHQRRMQEFNRTGDQSDRAVF